MDLNGEKNGRFRRNCLTRESKRKRMYSFLRPSTDMDSEIGKESVNESGGFLSETFIRD